MSKIGTYQETMRDCLASDVNTLPELNEHNIILITGPRSDARDLDAEIQQAAALVDGIALIIFNRSGQNPSPDDDLRLKIKLNLELYISPYKRDLSVNPDLRSPELILESLMRWLHQRVITSNSRHCFDETHVLGFNELPDPDFYVFRIDTERYIQF